MEKKALFLAFYRLEVVGPPNYMRRKSELRVFDLAEKTFFRKTRNVTARILRDFPGKKKVTHNSPPPL